MHVKIEMGIPMFPETQKTARAHTYLWAMIRVPHPATTRLFLRRSQLLA